MQNEKPIWRLLRRPAVLELVGLRNTQLNAAVARGEFPAPIKLTPGGRAVAWAEEEIIKWRNDRLSNARVKGAQT